MLFCIESSPLLVKFDIAVKILCLNCALDDWRVLNNNRLIELKFHQLLVTVRKLILIY